MFGDADDNGRRFPIIEFDRIIEEGPTNGLYKPSSAYGRGTPILRINNFYDGEVVGLEQLRRLEIDENETARFSLAENDIVINRVNSREYVGKSALIPKLSEKTVFESNIMRIRAKHDAVNPHFLIHALQTPSIKRQIQSKTKDAVNQSSINQADVRSLEFPLPPIAEQERFMRTLERLKAVRLDQQSDLEGREALFVSLQQRVFVSASLP